MSISDVITAKAITKYGLDGKSLRKRFEPEPGQSMGRAEQQLIKRWRDRAQGGRDQNLVHHRLYSSIDQAWDKPFSQTTASIIGMLRDLQELNGDTDAAVVAQKWGMSHLIVPEKDAKTGKETGRKLLNLPVFHGIHLSIDRSTLLMRISRILNERLSVPLMKFEPAFTSEKNQLRGEITTQRMECANREFGYSQTFTEAVQACAMYGQQLMLINEEWFEQKDVTDDGEQIGKEGLRYDLPHPSRSYYDIDYPTWTFNQDCGTKFVGKWKITTFGSVRSNTHWWNTDRIARSSKMGEPKWIAFFQTSGQCRMTAGQNHEWFSTIDRQSRMDSGTAYFSANEDDQPIWLTEHYEKFNPRVDFEDPSMPDAEIWFRIVLASDDTPIYVTALTDRPGVMWLYEPIGSRTIQQGLMLELMPFASHAENIMSQGILSAEQSLANVTFYDTDVIEKEDVKRDLMNPGGKFYRKLNFWGFSGRKMLKQNAGDTMFKTYRFPTLDVNTHLLLLSQLISLMKTVVGMSDQEIGSAASHEQSAEEIKAIHTSTSHRFEYVAAWIDFVFESWKRQAVTYYSQYSKLPAYAYLTAENFDRVKEAGYEFEQDRLGNMMVRVPMDMLRVEHWLAQRDGPNRIPWTTIGGQMLNFIQTFTASPIAQSLPPENVIKLINESLECLQFPRSFRIQLPGTADSQIPAVVAAYVQNQLKGLADQVKEFVGQTADESQVKFDDSLKRIEQAMKGYVDKEVGKVEKMIPEEMPTTINNIGPGSYSKS